MHANLANRQIGTPAPDCTLRLTFTPNSVAAVRGAWNGILQAQETLNYEPLEPRDDRP
jgi:hypothetical protein